MPCGASSTARVSVRWLIAALAAPYGAIRTAARVVSPSSRSRSRPRSPTATIACASAWHDHMVTNRFCSTMSRRASSSRSRKSPGRAAGERSDVVHRDVETAELGHRAVDEPTHAPRAGAGRHPRPTTRVPSAATSATASASGPGALSAMTTSQPGPGQPSGDPPPDADARAGDQRPLSRRARGRWPSLLPHRRVVVNVTAGTRRSGHSHPAQRPLSRCAPP